MKSTRKTLGYINGEGGRFGRLPFYSVRLSADQCAELDAMFSKADAQGRKTTTITSSFHQPNRLRITEAEPPDYELRAAKQYVRGDVIRVQGKEGVSCGLDLSARFGVPLVREQLNQALATAKHFVEFRVPSRKRDVIEFVPDVDLPPADEEALAGASVASARLILPPEDFSDWEA